MANEEFRRWRERAAALRTPPAPPPGEVDPHLAEDDEHIAPSRTMPQGTQEHGVDHGHEERDVNLPALLRWAAGLVVLTVAVQLFLWGVFYLLLARETTKDVFPSQLFVAKQVPPLPRLVPNPVDARERPVGPLQDPMEHLQEFLKREDRSLERLGLIDGSTGLPRLPDSALEALVPPGARTGVRTLVVQPAPSDSSGGTTTENALR